MRVDIDQLDDTQVLRLRGTTLPGPLERLPGTVVAESEGREPVNRRCSVTPKALGPSSVRARMLFGVGAWFLVIGGLGDWRAVAVAE